MSYSNLPPIEGTGVFIAKASQEINASSEKVWEILTSISLYAEWNPFVRSMVITKASKQPEKDQMISKNKYIVMKVHLPPSMDDSNKKQTVFLRITDIDEENHRVAWEPGSGYPRWLLHHVRWQSVSTVNGKTLYESREVFSGILAYFVKWFVGSNVQAGFEAMAESLKRRAESS